MLSKMSSIALLLVLVAVPFLVAPANGGGEGMEPTYHAIVQGGPNGLKRLKLFHE